MENQLYSVGFQSLLQWLVSEIRIHKVEALDMLDTPISKANVYGVVTSISPIYKEGTKL